jgi:hypothetical protein
VVVVVDVDVIFINVVLIFKFMFASKMFLLNFVLYELYLNFEKIED